MLKLDTEQPIWSARADLQHMPADVVLFGQEWQTLDLVDAPYTTG